MTLIGNSYREPNHHQHLDTVGGTSGKNAMQKVFSQAGEALGEKRHEAKDLEKVRWVGDRHAVRCSAFFALSFPPLPPLKVLNHSLCLPTSGELP